MSLTKYILKEFISDTKRSVLHRKLFFAHIGLKDDKSSYVNELYDICISLKETNSGRAVLKRKNDMDRIINNTTIDILDNTPNKKYIEWFLFKPNSPYTNFDESSIAKVFIPYLHDALSFALIKGNDDATELLNRLQVYKDDIENTSKIEPLITKNRLILDGFSIFEDHQRINDAFDLHFNLKQRADFPQQYKDINNIKSFDELMTIIKPYRQGGLNEKFEKVIEKIQENKDYKLLYEDSEVEIYVPLTEQGACTLGYKTDWCTTWGKNSFNTQFEKRTNHFSTYEDKKYFKQPPLYIVRWLKLDEDSPTKYVQIYLGKSQEMQVRDVDDKSLGDAYSYARNQLPTKAFHAIVKDITSNELNKRT